MFVGLVEVYVSWQDHLVLPKELHYLDIFSKESGGNLWFQVMVIFQC